MIENSSMHSRAGSCKPPTALLSCCRVRGYRKSGRHWDLNPSKYSKSNGRGCIRQSRVIDIAAERRCRRFCWGWGHNPELRRITCINNSHLRYYNSRWGGNRVRRCRWTRWTASRVAGHWPRHSASTRAQLLSYLGVYIIILLNIHSIISASRFASKWFCIIAPMLRSAPTIHPTRSHPPNSHFSLK